MCSTEQCDKKTSKFPQERQFTAKLLLVTIVEVRVENTQNSSSHDVYKLFMSPTLKLQ